MLDNCQLPNRIRFASSLVNVAKYSQRGVLYSVKNWHNIQAVSNFTAEHFVAKGNAMKYSQKSHL